MSEWDHDIRRTQATRFKSPEMELKCVAENELGKALMDIIFPESEKDDKGNITVLRKSNGARVYDPIFLEVKGVRYEFVVTGGNEMNYDYGVMEMSLNFIGRLKE